jgi:hypothetical protein
VLALNHFTVLIFGGFRGMSQEYDREFMTVDLRKNEYKKLGRGLIAGDMFFNNQFVLNPRTKLLCLFGKEHVHYLDLVKIKAVGIIRDDGDYPSAQFESDSSDYTEA